MKLSTDHWTFFEYQDNPVIVGKPHHNTHPWTDAQFDELWQMWRQYEGSKLRIVTRDNGHCEVEFVR